MENTLWNRTTDISKTSKTPVILLACSAAVLLASCSAGPADGTAAGSTASPEPSTSSAAATSQAATPPPSSETATADNEPVPEPLSPTSRYTPYPPEELVLSEKGTGTQSYVLEGGMEADQLITVGITLANCSPGDTVSIKTNPVMLGAGNIGCESMPMTISRITALRAAVPELEFTVEASSGASFWVQARVYRDEAADGSGQ